MSIPQVRCQPSSQPHLALDWLSNTRLCWRKRNEGGRGIYKHLFREWPWTCNRLCLPKGGPMWKALLSRSAQRVRWDTPVPPSPAFDSLSTPGNQVLLRKNPITLVLTDEHVKIDVSVIFTISRVAAKEPAGPHVGTDVGSGHLVLSINTFPCGAYVLPTRAILSVYVIMHEFHFCCCCQREKHTAESLLLPLSWYSFGQASALGI